jgi:hypothetical protein
VTTLTEMQLSDIESGLRYLTRHQNRNAEDVNRCRANLNKHYGLNIPVGDEQFLTRLNERIAELGLAAALTEIHEKQP